MCVNSVIDQFGPAWADTIKTCYLVYDGLTVSQYQIGCTCGDQVGERAQTLLGPIAIH